LQCANGGGRGFEIDVIPRWLNIKSNDGDTSGCDGRDGGGNCRRNNGRNSGDGGGDYSCHIEVLTRNIEQSKKDGRKVFLVNLCNYNSLE
jgi:hypothetical protein